MTTEDEKSAKKKKIPPGSVKLQMVGDLMLARCPDRSLSGLFRRYEALLEKLANMPREERLINYKFFVALILTSHAKKSQEVDERKALFDLKNDLYFNIANNRETRRKVAFRYLASKNFRVLGFCPACEKKNAESNLPRHQWKFCKDCNVDRKFYNVLSMHHKFEGGSATMFLSNDLIHKVIGIRLTQKGRLEDHREEALFDKYQYNVRNLDVFDLESVKTIQKRLLEIS